MAMAPKAEIPLYHHQNRLSRSASSRRRRAGAPKKRAGSGACCSGWNVLLISPLVLLSFGLGTFVGIELAQAPGGAGTGLHQGASAPGGNYMPPLEHPKQQAPAAGWNANGNGNGIGNGDGNGIIPTPPHQPQPLQPPQPPQVRHAIGSRDETGGHKPKPKPHLPGGPGHGGIPGGGGGNFAGNSDGGVGVVGATMPWLQTHSFHSREGAYVSLKESLDNSQEVTATAFIYVDREMSDIKTILGNKMSGCGADALGFALYVNEWNKKDGQLWLEWGDGARGCQKIHSKKKVPVGRWVHVAARIDGAQGQVSILMDGDVVELEGTLGESEEGSRRPGSREDFSIGAFANGDFPFDGRIGAVTVYASALTNTQIAELARLSADHPIKDAVAGPLVSAEHHTLLVALQLDEAADAKNEKDGTVAWHANHLGGHDVGVYHFMHMQEPPKVDEHLKDGISTTPVTEAMRAESDRVGRERAVKVKEAMQHAWRGYEQHAWGADELAPRGKKGKQNWGGMGVTLVDSLDTLWLMDMKDEFWRARDWVRDKLTYSHASEVSVFETTIRELGGLLSAYDLSGDEAFKTKAKELGDKLLPAFETRSGVPTPRVSFKTGRNSGGSKSVLAEIGTLQVEFRYLTHITGIPVYAEKANRVFDHMHDLNSNDGLYPIHLNPATGKSVGNQVTFGALGDSFYEYLLKVWLQGGRTETKYREMYDRAMDGMTRKLLQKSDPSGLTYVSDWNGRGNVHKMDHLVCFVAGTLALGAQTATDPVKAERDMKTAKALAYTCYQMYARQKTGLAPEMVNFEKGRDMVVPPKTAYNILRPETAEALFVLHQITGDPIYREWSWEIFQAFEKYCRLPVAFGSFPNVNDPRAQPEDRMESFFLAETLKYLYLIQEPELKVDLTKYVFNTEAHPLKVFDFTDQPPRQPSFGLRGNVGGQR
eukprot:g14242.t1